MILIYEEQMYSKTSEDIRRVVIQADTTPSTFPLTGADVTGLNDSAHIAPGSMIHCVDSGKNYFMNEDGDEWLEDGGNA